MPAFRSARGSGVAGRLQRPDELSPPIQDGVHPICLTHFLCDVQEKKVIELIFSNLGGVGFSALRRIEHCKYIATYWEETHCDVIA